MCAHVSSVNGPTKWPLAEGGNCVNVTDNLLWVRLGLTGSVHIDIWIYHPVQGENGPAASSFCVCLYIGSHFKQSLDQNVVGRGMYEKDAILSVGKCGELLCES